MGNEILISTNTAVISKHSPTFTPTTPPFLTQDQKIGVLSADMTQK